MLLSFNGLIFACAISLEIGIRIKGKKKRLKKCGLIRSLSTLNRYFQNPLPDFLVPVLDIKEATNEEITVFV